MDDSSHKPCAICGVIYPMTEFIYGNRDNRAYCKSCDRAEKAAYRQGGTEAARKFREEMRIDWQ